MPQHKIKGELMKVETTKQATTSNLILASQTVEKRRKDGDDETYFKVKACQFANITQEKQNGLPR